VNPSEVSVVRFFPPTFEGPTQEGDGYRAALVNFRSLAHAVWTTRETVERIEAAMAGA
jgi:hypothetical protein